MDTHITHSIGIAPSNLAKDRIEQSLTIVCGDAPPAKSDVTEYFEDTFYHPLDALSNVDLIFSLPNYDDDTLELIIPSPTACKDEYQFPKLSKCKYTGYVETLMSDLAEDRVYYFLTTELEARLGKSKVIRRDSVKDILLEVKKDSKSGSAPKQPFQYANK